MSGLSAIVGEIGYLAGQVDIAYIVTDGVDGMMQGHSVCVDFGFGLLKIKLGKSEIEFVPKFLEKMRRVDQILAEVLSLECWVVGSGSDAPVYVGKAEPESQQKC